MKRSMLLIALLMSIVVNSATAQSSVSFVEFSKMKVNSETIGKYLGILQYCEGNEILEDSLSLFMDITLIVDASNAYEITLGYLEETGLPFDELEKLDEIIRNTKNTTYSGFAPQAEAAQRNPLSAASQQVTSICVEVVSRSQNFNNIDSMPSDPIERIDYLAAISPLQ